LRIVTFAERDILQHMKTLPTTIDRFAIALLLATPLFIAGCTVPAQQVQSDTPHDHAPEWFSLRPETEKAYGYTHAVRIGNSITVSGAVSMNDAGEPTAVGDFAQQMKNCYSDLEKVLKHYGCTWDDVVVENVFTTDMAAFLEHAAYRSEIYKKQFPAGSWLEVKGLALPEFLIEIELEVHKSHGLTAGK
jgi:2-iminobutanoate/2-iminopropanoate deaminase